MLEKIFSILLLHHGKKSMLIQVERHSSLTSNLPRHWERLGASVFLSMVFVEALDLLTMLNNNAQTGLCKPLLWKGGPLALHRFEIHAQACSNMFNQFQTCSNTKRRGQLTHVLMPSNESNYIFSQHWPKESAQH